jgi:hypothetical protein
VVKEGAAKCTKCANEVQGCYWQRVSQRGVQKGETGKAKVAKQASQVRSCHFSFEAWTNNSWMIVPKVRVISPREVVEAGPSKVLECPAKSLKGKEKAVNFLETGKVKEAELVGLSDEQWSVHQWFLADHILQKCLEIEALFWEVVMLEGMMGEM